MKTLREKITLTLIAIAWVVFHLRTGPNLSAIIEGTIIQIFATAPYAVGSTIILIGLLRVFTGGIIPPWDRILRIFFTISIFFAFFFAIYEHVERGQQVKMEDKDHIIISEPMGED
jgi:hypothetical protein